MEHKRIMEIDRLIVDFAIKTFIDAGYTLGVNDGEDIPLRRCVDADKLRGALMAVDQSTLLVFDPRVVAKDGGAARVGGLFFVFGECGYDVINDHTCYSSDSNAPLSDKAARFNATMDVVNAYATTFETEA